VGVEEWTDVGTDVIIGVIFRDKTRHEKTTSVCPPSICYLVLATKPEVGDLLVVLSRSNVAKSLSVPT
jgi:hypothetical protein